MADDGAAASGHGGGAGRRGAGGSAGRGGEATGHGLRGMRERAASVGGEVTARPLPGGGFQVTATLPVRVRPAAGAEPS